MLAPSLESGTCGPVIYPEGGRCDRRHPNKGRSGLRVAEPVRLYPPGFSVPESGLYWAIHGGHRLDHLVLALKDESFPSCRTCGGRVRFKLAQPLNHFASDWDFAGPNLELLEPKPKYKVA